MARSAKSASTRTLKPLRGYPKREAFAFMQDVKAYLDQDKIVCLLCGRSFVKLSNHVVKTHGIASDDYRIRFGIPLSYGLAGKSYRAAERRRSRRLRRKGIIPAASRETIQNWIRARMKRRPVSQATRQQSRERMLKLAGKDVVWQRKDYEEYLRRVLSGRLIAEVGRDKDMPSAFMFFRHLTLDADFKRKYHRLREAMPFARQVRTRLTGQRYCRTIVRLRTAGNTWPEIARIMQVRESSVRNMWHRLKRSGRIKEFARRARR